MIPSRWRRVWPPVALGAGAVASAVYIALVDPNQPGHYLVCPTNSLLGIDCPGCGGLRATHDLLHGNVAGAMDHNLLWVIAAPILVVMWARWLARRWTGAPPKPSPRWQKLQTPVLTSVIAVVIAFGVVRNLVPYLGSNIG
jgi:hypothetical protein